MMTTSLPWVWFFSWMDSTKLPAGWSGAASPTQDLAWWLTAIVGCGNDRMILYELVMWWNPFLCSCRSTRMSRNWALASTPKELRAKTQFYKSGKLILPVARATTGISGEMWGGWGLTHRSRRMTLLYYVGALLEAEPNHFPMITSRPGKAPQKNIPFIWWWWYGGTLCPLQYDGKWHELQGYHYVPICPDRIHLVGWPSQ